MADSGRVKRKLFRFVVQDDCSGWRLDRFVPEQTDELSRTLLRKVIDLGGVHVDGRRVRKCSLALAAGSAVEVYIDGLGMDPFRLEEGHVLFRDRHLLAVDKPAGIETQPTHARFKGTLFEALQLFLQDPLRLHQKPTIGMVQRLDRDTSGVVVYSIHPAAHKGLTETFTGRQVEKSYLALVFGIPDRPEAEIRSLLAKQRKTNKVKSVAAGGKEAVTRYRLLETFEDCALLRIQILTGRSHQIRAHMSEMGHPLLGDLRYGGPESAAGQKVGRQMLHADRLRFKHPVTGADLDLESPLPHDMQSLLDRLRHQLAAG